MSLYCCAFLCLVSNLEQQCGTGTAFEVMLGDFRAFLL